VHNYLVRASSRSNPLNATYGWIIPFEDGLVQYADSTSYTAYTEGDDPAIRSDA